MVNTKQLLSFEKENINLTELKLDEADRLAETDNTRFTHSEIFENLINNNGLSFGSPFICRNYFLRFSVRRYAFVCSSILRLSMHF